MSKLRRQNTNRILVESTYSFKHRLFRHGCVRALPCGALSKVHEVNVVVVHKVQPKREVRCDPPCDWQATENNNRMNASRKGMIFLNIMVYAT